jgi:hypothetical protein
VGVGFLMGRGFVGRGIRVGPVVPPGGRVAEVQDMATEDENSQGDDHEPSDGPYVATEELLDRGHGQDDENGDVGSNQ